MPDFLRELLARNMNISKKAYNKVKGLKNPELEERILRLADQNVSIVSEELVDYLLHNKQLALNWAEYEKWKHNIEQGKETKSFASIMESERKKVKFKVKTYSRTTSSGVIEDFIAYFNDRYDKLSKILRGRQAVKENLVSIGSLQPSNEEVSIIGMVLDQRETKKRHHVLELEDKTARVTCIIMKNKRDVHSKAENIVFDEVIAVKGQMGRGAFFANDIIWPELPNTVKPKTIDTDSNAVFISDLQVGSDKFLEKEFIQFIEWLRGEIGNEQQKHLASNVKYLFIGGDVVDGIGIYPGQENELRIKDLYTQYDEAAKYLKLVPKDINIFIIPGNHDAVRLAQPQPKLPEDYAAALYELDNTHLLSNPSTVEVEGLSVLMYHGTSFDTLIENVPNLSYHAPDKIMINLLQRRHLAPIYGQDTAPEKEDHLVIDPIPDIIQTGHIHYNGATTYKGVTLINSGTWQSRTAYQELLGQTPTPCQVPIMSLKNREVKVINFAE